MTEKKCANCQFWSANIEKPDVAEGCFACWCPEVGGDKGGEEGTDCKYFMGSDSTEANVPDHLTGKPMRFDANPNKIDGPCEILIVTYWKDFPWLDYCLRSINKFCSGFSGVTLAIPNRDIEKFHALWNDSMQPARIVGFDEVPGKGMLHHMAMMVSADQIVPCGTKYVLHHDADGIFTMPSTPEHFFANDKPYYLIRTWASLGVLDRRHPVARVASDCAMWKGPTDAQLGWDTEWYTMCVNTQAMPIEFYAPYRQYLEERHRQPFVQYMTSGRNEWPQDIMDYTAMGAWAKQYMPEFFTWFDVENGQPFPGDRKKAYHSHSGITPEIRAEIEGFLSRYVPTEEESEKMKE
jgi:hypothetical protein